MKKGCLIIIMFICLFNASCKSNMIEDAIANININKEITEDIELPTNYKNVEISWKSSNEKVLTNNGNINPQTEDINITLTAIFKSNKAEKIVLYNVVVIAKVLTDQEYLDQTVSQFIFNPILSKGDSYTLPSKIKNVNIEWSCEVEDLVKNNILYYMSTEQEVTLIAKFTYLELVQNKSYELNIPASVSLKKIDEVITEYEINNNFIIKNPKFQIEDSYLDVSLKYYFPNYNLIDQQGNVNFGDSEQIIQANVIFMYNGLQIEKNYNFTIISKADYAMILFDNFTKNFRLESPQQFKDIELPTIYNSIVIDWYSLNYEIENNVLRVGENFSGFKATIFATLKYDHIVYPDQLKYEIRVPAAEDIEILNYYMDHIVIELNLKEDIKLRHEFPYNIEAIYTSSNSAILTNDGKINRTNIDQNVTFNIKLILGALTMEKSFELTVLQDVEKVIKNKKHQIIYRVDELFKQTINNIVKKDNKLNLNSGALSGQIESEVINTESFKSLVASWAAITNDVTSIELFVKVCVDNKWSNYLSYKKWGLGLQNKCVDSIDSNNIAKISDDEIIILNNKTANKIQFKVELSRNAVTTNSPQLSLISFALNINNYQYNVNKDALPNEILYDLPRLYQGEVPTIGNSICSPTSITMLLKYKGLSFVQYDTYEHRYIAGLAKDYGNNIYGNWSYNTAVMGAYGFDAYVARMYSIDELMANLAYVGPVAISVRGQMTSNEKNYYTNGHLLVVVGYRYENDNLIIICNDPNVGVVRCEYSENIIKNTWRNIVYVIE